MRLLRILLRVAIVFTLLLALWDARLLYQLAKPTLIAVVPGLAPTTSTTAAAADDVSATDTLTYARLGIAAPISIDPATSPLVTSDWNTIRQALMHGVSLAYTGSTFASTPLAFVTGHSSDSTPHPYDSIFAGLGQAKVGDTFTIMVDRTPYTYSVIATHELKPTDAQGFLALTPPDNATVQHVALVTCWPPLTTARRFVVLGERSTAPTPAPQFQTFNTQAARSNL